MFADAVLAVCFVLGAAFAVVASLPRRGRRPPPDADVTWPVLLGSGQQHLDAATRLAIAKRLAARQDDWRIPILLCAQAQERDPEIFAVVDRALAQDGRRYAAHPSDWKA